MSPIFYFKTYFFIFIDKERMTLIEKDVHFTLMELCTTFPNDPKLMSEVTNLLRFLSAEGKMLFDKISCVSAYETNF